MGHLQGIVNVEKLTSLGILNMDFAGDRRQVLVALTLNMYAPTATTLQQQIFQMSTLLVSNVPAAHNFNMPAE